ncbi:PfkB domain protein [Chthoniobacter flavus Ellin428]|uniref:PfkB domain protein n=1 Tax=Chthoniobacter flavus Ellin428 TaxID=497964 RepID=B4CZ47_9BACT|nr:PfkB family carbohydrate kinase [Chthoniobacter flavus]EDY20738.1 PfkB domain protein [Chthoniobacter flavus Ellin428]TCO89633.1 rfaE bifunctional protein kinase chain/domain [Chthoniobacter flavus]
MTPDRLSEIASRYSKLRIAVVGDLCLDRYLEIDPSRAEVSIETGLPVYNVARVRSQPGAAGTILNNLVALGVGQIFPVGFCGEDGEGYELLRALGALPGVDTAHFFQTSARRTFTYCKPLIMEPGQPPRELNRLDSKNWTPTPAEVADRIADSVEKLRGAVDAVILMDQVDVEETGVVTKSVLARVEALEKKAAPIPVLADSRRGLRGFSSVIFKMNAAELSALTGMPAQSSLEEVRSAAVELAQQNQRAVFVTMAERGLVGALPDGRSEHVPALALRGTIDVVGAGDSVTANLAAALAGGAELREALSVAALASSIVIHQLGTSGSASVAQMKGLLG